MTLDEMVRQISKHTDLTVEEVKKKDLRFFADVDGYSQQHVAPGTRDCGTFICVILSYGKE
jgi:hypothetical protein